MKGMLVLKISVDKVIVSSQLDIFVSYNCILYLKSFEVRESKISISFNRDLKF